MRTHCSICARVGVRLAPETDKEKAFSCETSGTVLGVQYNTVTWSWNIDCEKVKGILQMLYDMVESESVTNGHAMSIYGNKLHFSWQLSWPMAHIENSTQSFVCVAIFRFLVSYRYQFIAYVLEIYIISEPSNVCMRLNMKCQST